MKKKSLWFLTMAVALFVTFTALLRVKEVLATFSTQPHADSYFTFPALIGVNALFGFAIWRALGSAEKLVAERSKA